MTIEYRLPESDEVLSATMVAGAYDFGQAFAPFSAELPVSFERLGDYGVVRWGDFIHFVLPKLAILEEALSVEQNESSGGMILDLRGNGGGWLTLYETMASYFFTAGDPMPVHLFDSYFYDESVGERVAVYAPDYMISAPRPDFAYTGAVVVLIDQGCASACEYFTQHLQELDRATVIGQYPSSGAGGSVERATLPGGITLQFTQGGTYFAGTDIPNLEAKGVVPDIRVPITLESELARIQGEDPVLDAAVAFLDENSDRLAGTTWRWTSTLSFVTTEETPIEHDGVYEVTFNADGTVAITADCNQANGTYTRGEFDDMTVSVDITTLALCAGDSLSESFLQDLGAVTSLSFDGNRLVLVATSPDGELSGFIFEAVASEAMADEAVDPAMADTAGLTAEALRNATYTFEIYEDPITLTDGHWEGDPYVEGGASRPMVDYMAGSARFGDLNGDGIDDGVAFLSESGGGSGSQLSIPVGRR